jgi:proteic killer suppression protein
VTIVTIISRHDQGRVRHRGLKRLYEGDDRRGLGADQVERIRRVLAYLDRATGPRDMNLPGWRLHPLKGEFAGFWSVTVSANWRIVRRFEGGDATDVDYLDYY